MNGTEDLARAGLCAVCRFCQRVTSARASTFFLCGLARDDASFPRYPRLPVTSCPGYRPRD